MLASAALDLFGAAICALMAFLACGLGGLTLVFGGESMENLQADFRHRHRETQVSIVLLSIGVGLAILAYLLSR